MEAEPTNTVAEVKVIIVSMITVLEPLCQDSTLSAAGESAPAWGYAQIWIRLFLRDFLTL